MSDHPQLDLLAMGHADLVRELMRLSAELEEATQYVIWHREALAEGLVHLREADRLRASNKQLADLAIGLEERLVAAQVKLDRLRAENALMRDLLSEAYPIVENELSPDIPWCQEVTTILAEMAKGEQ